ncbi:NAD(P)/FAD-dependent oxidoreductase [Falsiroseomonas tokyonensis]|uniref:NAD(P)/FAD-dependent oxidoreductase n=1 Tax=Falsiroseomonas tokyonensis TaxID=430521 RepID=A0ABV7BV61_9PROT|nr:FAD-dependent oxidoreductase [Falsiroseomonas tokyonensis]MBU8538381.1 FAD-dependent oxidoreductase [Falsiroseomonas tokyonensis]
MSAAPSRILVIGAGIVGMAIAFRLRQSGAEVTVVDAEPPGEGGASFGNAGAISASSVAPLAMPGLLRQVPRMLLDRAAPLHVPAGYWLRAAPWLARFVAAARPAAVTRATAALDGLLRLATEQHMALAREIGAPELLRPHGQLYLYRDAAQLEKDRASWEIRRAHGARLEQLDRAGIMALEPAIGPAYQLGILLADHAHCASPLRYVRALTAAFEQAGGVVVRDRIVRLTTQDGRMTGAQGQAGQHAAEAVVLAAGAWSARLAEPLGYRIPLESQRGYHLDLHDPGIALTRPVIPADRKVFITPMETALRVAGTVEFGGLDRKPDPARAELLYADLAAVFPEARPARAEGFWMGHRPCLPDSVPVIGPARRVPGLFFAFGHGHLGLTGSAPTAEMLAPVVLGRPSNQDLAPYAAERFSGA